jgi:hypothetical protein
MEIIQETALAKRKPSQKNTSDLIFSSREEVLQFVFSQLSEE